MWARGGGGGLGEDAWEGWAGGVMGVRGPGLRWVRVCMGLGLRGRVFGDGVHGMYAGCARWSSAVLMGVLRARSAHRRTQLRRLVCPLLLLLWYLLLLPLLRDGLERLRRLMPESTGQSKLPKAVRAIARTGHRIGPDGRGRAGRPLPLF